MARCMFTCGQLPGQRAAALRRLPTSVRSAPGRCMRQAVRASVSADSPKWIQHADKVFDSAVRDISDYAQYLEDAGSDSRTARDVLDWIVSKRESLTEACLLEGGKTGTEECRKLDRMELLIQDLQYTSGVEDLVHVLSCQCNAETGKSAARGGTDEECSILRFASTFPDHADPGREDLVKLFNYMDKNQDGKLNMSEFSDAMSQLGDPVSPQTIATINQSFDTHGLIGLEDFLEIVSAEEIRAHSNAAKVLRGLGRSWDSNERPRHTPDWNT